MSEESAAGGAPTADDFRAAAGELLRWRRPLLVSHVRPDGDALGCLLGMRAILRGLGRQAEAVLYEPCPPRYRFLDGAADLHVLGGADDPLLGAVDGVLMMDTCARAQLEPLAGWLDAARIPKIALDHHATRDEIANVYLIDVSAAAASLLVYRWARAAGWALPEEGRRALFVGLTTDTGWFRYSNTSPECLRVAADLVEQGVDLDGLYKLTYLNDSASMLRGRAAALARVELFEDDTVAVMAVSQAMLTAARATPVDLEEVINVPMSAATVEVSVLLVEMGGGVVKCGLRSKGAVDVAALAAGLGGGGHTRAAGVRMNGTLDEVRVMILRAIRQARR